jgi:uncharacterized protein YjbI with pentapeptide repeats
MANEQHLSRLKEGILSFNAWRNENPEALPDLRRTVLNGVNLNAANFRSADLRSLSLKALASGTQT